MLVDQSAIKGSRRSNPATYTGLLEPIRKAFAKANGVKPALFSSNSEGACPTCNGNGMIYTELSFMETVATVCEDCGGKRFQADVLELRFGGLNIAEVLDLPVAEAHAFFADGRGQDAGSGDPAGADGGRGSWLCQAGSAAQHPVRGRAAAPQARHPPVRQGRDLRARRADERPAPGRRRQPAGPAGPAGRLGQVGHRDRAPPGRDGARRLDHRPGSGRRPRRRTGWSSRARPRTWWRGSRRSRESTWPTMSVPDGRISMS